MMNSRISLVSFIFALTASGAFAQPSLEGSWKFALGKKSPCQIGMSADGTVTPAPDCPAGIARWKGTANGVQLQTASGETFAVLKAKGAAYEGTAVADMRAVSLSR